MRYLRYLAAAGALAAFAGLTACGSAHSPVGGGPEAGAAAPIPAPTLGLLPASPQLTDRLALSRTSVTAGTPIEGTLVVTNHGPTVNLTHGCRPAYAVVLTSHRFPPDAAFPADCSVRSFIIKPGVNRLAVTVATTYMGCTADQKRATHSTPACMRGNRMPPLPEGRYHAVLVGSGNLRLPPPAPVAVTLTGP
ncbi:MAG TPA: hypothetical protein VH641_21855 [Streptosporangiaceae bacterium]